MKNLQTARICIIDDEKEFYLPIIHALSKIGLGCILFEGTEVEALPIKPISGLRIIFLDMQLGTAGDENQTAAHTANVFSKIVAHDTGIIIVVFWTKYEDLIEAFKSRLFETWNCYLGRLVFTRMDKPLVSTDIDADKLEADICDHLKKHYPIDLIWEWEQAVHDAASNTTSALTELATKRANVTITDDQTIMAKKIGSSFKFLLRLLLDASAGQNATNKTALKDLHLGLTPLHVDRLEHSSIIDSNSSASLLLKDNKPKPTPEESLAINSMLLIAPNDENTSKLCPGSLYTVEDVEIFKKTFKQKWSNVAEQIFDKTKIEIIEIEESIEKCRPLLAEVSADCDYAQRKRPVARLVAGVLLPSDLAHKFIKNKKLSNAQYLQHRNYLKLQQLEGDWYPIFNSQFVFSMSPKRLPSGFKPVGRLRAGPLAELRHWLATHTTRPGYLSI